MSGSRDPQDALDNESLVATRGGAFVHFLCASAD